MILDTVSVTAPVLAIGPGQHSFPAQGEAAAVAETELGFAAGGAMTSGLHVSTILLAFQVTVDINFDLRDSWRMSLHWFAITLCVFVLLTSCSRPLDRCAIVDNQPDTCFVGEAFVECEGLGEGEPRLFCAEGIDCLWVSNGCPFEGYQRPGPDCSLEDDSTREQQQMPFFNADWGLAPWDSSAGHEPHNEGGHLPPGARAHRGVQRVWRKVPLFEHLPSGRDIEAQVPGHLRGGAPVNVAGPCLVLFAVGSGRSPRTRSGHLACWVRCGQVRTC